MKGNVCTRDSAVIWILGRLLLKCRPHQSEKQVSDPPASSTAPIPRFGSQRHIQLPPPVRPHCSPLPLLCPWLQLRMTSAAQEQVTSVRRTGAQEQATLVRTGAGQDRLKNRWRPNEPEKQVGKLRQRLPAVSETTPDTRTTERKPTNRPSPLSQFPQPPLWW